MSFLAKAAELTDGLFGSIPFARIVYSLILAALIIVLGHELLSVWDRGKIFLATFSYFDGGVKKADYGEQLRNETILDYGLILDLIKRYPPKVETDDQPSTDADDCESKSWWEQLRSSAASKYRQWTTATKQGLARLNARITGKPVEFDGSGNDDGDVIDCRQKTIVRANVDRILQNLQTEKLDKVVGQLDVTVQGISLKSLLSAFGSLVYPRNTEIAASIYSLTGQERRTVLSVSGAPTKSQGLADGVPKVFNIDSGVDDPENAFRIACFLVWAQWENQEDDRSKHVAYDELCNWGKILTIKDESSSSTAYNLDAKKKKLKLQFLKEQFALAAQLDIGMHEIYASLVGLEDFVGKEKILLSGGAETDVNSLADILRYLAFTKSTSRDKRNRDGDWTKGLPTQGAGRKEINQNFFKSRIGTDCGQNLLGDAKNVVRITRPFTNRKKVTSKLITSGLIVADDFVISIAAGSVDPKRLEPFAQAEVSVVSCDKVSEPLKVTAVEYLDSKAGTPFIRLTVPGLKRRDPAPRFNFDGLSVDRSIVAAGHIRNTDLIFATRQELNDSDTSIVTNNVTHLLEGRVVAPYYDDFAEDRERRFYLNTLFGAGLTGAPIFDRYRTGVVIGFVENGTYVGENLSIGVGLSITSLKQNALLAPKPDVE